MVNRQDFDFTREDLIHRIGWPPPLKAVVVATSDGLPNARGVRLRVVAYGRLERDHLAAQRALMIFRQSHYPTILPAPAVAPGRRAHVRWLPRWANILS